MMDAHGRQAPMISPAGIQSGMVAGLIMGAKKITEWPPDFIMGGCFFKKRGQKVLSPNGSQKSTQKGNGPVS
jgi:hypothetical protein